MIKIKSVEIYSNDEKKRVPPKYATRRDVYILDGMDITEHFVERGNWKSESKEAYIIKYDRDATEEFREEEHPREEDGKFTDKGGGVGKKAKTRRRRKSRSKTPKYIPKKYDTPFSWRDTSKPLSSKQKFNYRSRKHDIKTYRSKGKNYPLAIHISDEMNPELVKIFTDFWNTNSQVKAMIKHIDYLGLIKQKNPKDGGVWYPDQKKIIIYDYPSQTPPYFKSTIVHEIVGHTYWDLAREWYRNDLIEFNELANKMPPVNQYCKDGLEKHGWKEMNDETSRQLRALDRKYGIKEDEYGYSNLEEQLWGDDLEKYKEDHAKIIDGKFIGNPSNEYMNRDSSSMTRYANEQHSAITEIMYDTLKDNIGEGADRVLIGKEDKEKLKVLWRKLHPTFPQKVGESWNIFNEAFVEDEHPRDEDGKFSDKGSFKSSHPDFKVSKLEDIRPETLAVIKKAWNDVPDEFKKGVRDLQLLEHGSDNMYKVGGYTRGSLKIYDNMFKKPDDFISTVKHELAHSWWDSTSSDEYGNDLESPAQDKFRAFVDTIGEAPTDYTNKFKFGGNGNYGDWGRNRINKENGFKYPEIFYNEIHSDVTAYVLGSSPHTNVNEDIMKKMVVAWKELHPKSSESEFKEDEHPRGQPDNAGQFVSKGGGSSKDAIHGEKVKKYESTLDIEQKKEDVDKAVNIESKVIGGVYDFIKDKSYKDKIKWVETQGSFAKGTDLGSSDLDIFIGFDYSLSIDEIQEITLDIGKNVLNPISDSGKYKIKHGADKDYPESYVDGIEVQIIGTSDVTLDQIRKGYDEGGMKTATDRTPHHTRFMKKALRGKEQEVRKLKRFFKDSGVYDSSMAKQGFSGFSTEVLIHNLGSFAKVIGYFANFVKGSVVGNTDRKFNTPLVMVDPLDPNRNLASAFSHSEKDGNIAPNKNLARLIKSAKSLVKTGKLPKITKEKLPSVSVSFHVDNTIDNNEVFGQLYSSALSMSATLKRNGYIVKSPKDKITKDFTVDVPRINVDYDEDSGKATLNFALDNFDKKYRYVGGISEDLSDDKLKAFYDNHKGEKLVKKNGRIYAEQENEYPTAEKLMKAIVSGEKKNSTVGKLEKYIKQAVISKDDREYENITDKPSSTEGLSKILNTNDYIKEDDVRQLAKDLLEAEGY